MTLTIRYELHDDTQAAHFRVDSELLRTGWSRAHAGGWQKEFGETRVGERFAPWARGPAHEDVTACAKAAGETVKLVTVLGI